MHKQLTDPCLKNVLSVFMTQWYFHCVCVLVTALYVKHYAEHKDCVPHVDIECTCLLVAIKHFLVCVL